MNTLTAHAATESLCSGDHSGWTAITETKITTPGKYYLAENIDGKSGYNALTIECAGEVILCLNGKTITVHPYGASNSNAINLKSGNLYMCDCGGSGKLTGTGGLNSGVYIGSEATFNMYGGTITGLNRLGVSVVGVFNMYGGSITGNVSDSTAVNVFNGTFNMYGGSITDNQGYGVDQNIYGSGAQAIYLEGNVKISGNTRGNICLRNSKILTVGELTDGAEIYVTSANTGSHIAITEKNTADYSKYFHADDSSYQILNKDNVIYLHKHSYTYSASGDDTVTEKCANCNDHNETAKLVLDPSASLKYTGSAIQPLEVEYSDGWLGDTLDITYSNNTAVSTDTVKARGSITIGDVTATKEFVIEKGDMNITASGYEGSYDRAEHSITVTAPVGATIQYRTSETEKWSDTNPTFTNVGTNTVYYKVTKANYNDVTGSAIVKIDPADMTVTAKSYSGTYDGNLHTITVSAPDGTKIEYRLRNTDEWSTTLPAVTNPTESPVTIYYRVTRENYKEVTGSATVTIDKINPTADMFTFTAPSDPVYDGNVKEASIVKTDGKEVGTITLKYYSDANPNGTIEAPKDAGTYTVKILVNGNDFYSATEEPIYPTDGTNWTYTIEPREIDIEWTDTEFIYDATEKLPTATANNLVSGDSCTITVTGKQIDAGTYTATAESVDNNNYKLPTNATTSFKIINKDQEQPVLTSTNETIDNKNDGTISGLTTAMEYRKSGEENYTAITEDMLENDTLENLSAGTYYVRYAAKKNYNASPDTEVTISAGKKLNVNIPESQNGYTLTVDKATVSWSDSATLTFALKEGYSKTDGFTVKVNDIPVTLDADDKYTISNIQANQTVTVEGVADITAPTAVIEIVDTDNKWEEFISDITFEIFFNKTQEVTITAEDVNTGSGLDKVYYYLSETEIAEADIADVTDWVEYTAPFNIDPDDEYIIYAKATDNAGNVVYINSNGLVLDATAPVITGIENNGTYYGDTVFGITESYLDTVTLDNATITLTDGKYTITADDKEHTIIATDKATNTSATIKIKVVAIASLDDEIESITTSNVKSSDKEEIKEILDFVNSLIDSGKDFTDSEDAKLAEIKSNAEELLKRIENAENAADNETTGKVDNITSDNVTVSDKENLEDAKADLEQALQDYPDNFTESEKEAIEADIQRLEDAIKSIEKVEDVVSQITNLPTEVEPDDLESVAKIEEAKAVYDALTDHEKSLISAEGKEKLESLLAQSVDYKIVEGDGSSIREDLDGTLRFKANGAYSKFTGIKVDNNIVDAQYYAAESGSTIITLKNEFLDKLSVGTHSLTVMYTDGEATGSFTIKAEPSSSDSKGDDTNAAATQEKNVPLTGDRSNTALYVTTLLLSGTGLVLLTAIKRRKRN